MPSPNPLKVFTLLNCLAPRCLAETEETPAPKRRRRIYATPIVICLMIYQRLQKGCSQSAAVTWLCQHRSELWPEGTGCKRVEQATISCQTGAYCQARQKLPTLVCSRLLDQLSETIQTLLPPPPGGRRVVVIDGTTLRLTHAPELVQAYPPGGNQHGENHWPTLRVVAFHDAHSGLATRPSWGPMYGKHAVSEQHLALAALEHVPRDAVVMADANFGIFHFAFHVLHSGRPVLFRLTKARAQKMLGGKVNKPLHRAINWTPSAHERRAHPDLPEQAAVKGWVIVCRHPQNRKQKLYLFTTLAEKPKPMLALYKQRWNIETDLRHLKRTVHLHELTGKSKAMIEKELLIGVASYNLVRAVMGVAAAKAGLVPRQLSFANTLAGLQALPWIDPSRPAADYQHHIEMLLAGILQTRLPHRSAPRSYPRLVWGRGASFPSHSAALRPAENGPGEQV